MDGPSESGSALSGERKLPTLCRGGSFLRALKSAMDGGFLTR